MCVAVRHWWRAADAWLSLSRPEAGGPSDNALCCHAVTGMIKLALPAGKANPAPPVGPALGAKVGRSRACGVLLHCAAVCATAGNSGQECGSASRCSRALGSPRHAGDMHARAFDSHAAAMPASQPARPPAVLHSNLSPDGRFSVGVSKLASLSCQLMSCTISLPTGRTPLPPPPRHLQGVNIMQFCKEYNAATQVRLKEGKHNLVGRASCCAASGGGRRARPHRRQEQQLRQPKRPAGALTPCACLAAVFCRTRRA